MFISDAKIDELIASDGAYLDLTTELLRGCVNLDAPARLNIKTRENLVFSGGQIVAKIVAKFCCAAQNLPP